VSFSGQQAAAGAERKTQATELMMKCQITPLTEHPTDLDLDIDTDSEHHDECGTSSNNRKCAV
jgi:hypothetical protein